jgi:hypothetical protein
VRYFNKFILDKNKSIINMVGIFIPMDYPNLFPLGNDCPVFYCRALMAQNGGPAAQVLGTSSYYRGL